MTNVVFQNMRKERLRYAIQREADRQALTMTPDAEQHLVLHAAAHLEAYFDDDERLNLAAERAERVINPVITALAEHAGTRTAISETHCRGFLAQPTVSAFPWTASKPD